MILIRLTIMFKIQVLLYIWIVLENIVPASLSNVPFIYNSVGCDPMTNMFNTLPVPSQTKIVPVDSRAVKAARDSLNSTYLWESRWPDAKTKLGSVSAVAFDLAGNVVVFHRGDRVWEQHTFNDSHWYIGSRTPISTPTLIAFNQNTGLVEYATGMDLFFMPHGLTIDKKGLLYVTDVALHQVFQFRRDGSSSLHKEWEMGDRFQPKTFCKPTSVAVLDNGDFFVADGYCHYSIIKYSKDRVELTRWGKNTFQGVAYPVAPEHSFAIPHSLTLADDLQMLCVADRENGRVQCFDYNGVFRSQFHSPVIGDRLFSVAYVPRNGGQLFVVNGPTWPENESDIGALGFVIDMKNGCILSKISPESSMESKSFKNPHDIIVSKDGNEVYVANLAPNIVYKLVNIDIQAYNSSLPSYGTLPIAANDTRPSESLSQPAPSLATVFLFVMLPLGIVILFGCLVMLVARRRRSLGNRLDARNYRQFMTPENSEL